MLRRPKATFLWRLACVRIPFNYSKFLCVSVAWKPTKAKNSCENQVAPIPCICTKKDIFYDLYRSATQVSDQLSVPTPKTIILWNASEEEGYIHRIRHANTCALMFSGRLLQYLLLSNKHTQRSDSRQVTPHSLLCLLSWARDLATTVNWREWQWWHSSCFGTSLYIKMSTPRSSGVRFQDHLETVLLPCWEGMWPPFCLWAGRVGVTIIMAGTVSLSHQHLTPAWVEKKRSFMSWGKSWHSNFLVNLKCWQIVTSFIYFFLISPVLRRVELFTKSASRKLSTVSLASLHQFFLRSVLWRDCEKFPFSAGASEHLRTSMVPRHLESRDFFLHEWWNIGVSIFTSNVFSSFPGTLILISKNFGGHGCVSSPKWGLSRVHQHFYW